MDGARRLSLPHLMINRADTPLSMCGYERTDSPFEIEPTTITCLPTELLLFIFSFLNINERLSVARVCSTWRHLIFSTSSLWGKKQLKLKCNRQSHQSKRSCLYAKRLGQFLRKLTVTCEHPNNHQCKYMAVCFWKLIKNLKSKNPALTSFKVIDLRLGGATQVVVTKISTLLSRLLETLTNLKSFQMSSAQWPPEEGRAVMSTLLRASRDTLETLQIDGYFVPRYTPAEIDQFSGDIAALNRLTKLAIDYFYLTADSVIVLADARRGQMRKLKLLSSDISPNTQYISTLAWKHLVMKRSLERAREFASCTVVFTASDISTSSCPAMKVEFCIKGFVISPSRSIPAILDPVLRISMIRLSIGGQFTFIDTPRLNMAAVFHHIMVHFKKRLVRFEMDIDNYNDFIDAAFIRMVKKCKHLQHLKVIAFFQNEETDMIVTEMVQARRLKQDGRSSKLLPRDIPTPFGASNDEAVSVNAGGDNGKICDTAVGAVSKNGSPKSKKKTKKTDGERKKRKPKKK